MSAGDNTLNALTALQTMKVMQQFDSDVKLDPKDLRAHVMENYVKFLTTPGRQVCYTNPCKLRWQNRFRK